MKTSKNNSRSNISGLVKELNKRNKKAKKTSLPSALITATLLIIVVTVAFLIQRQQGIRGSAAAGEFVETFDGNPSAPQPLTQLDQSKWDIAVHSRSISTYDNLSVMQAHHGPDCGTPLDTSGNLVTHSTNGSYEGSVFNCKDHIMTAINEEDYGVIYLTPNSLADISNGTTSIKFDVSTYRASSRDWIDLWLTPYEDNLQLPLDEWLPDLQGTPKNGIHIKEDQGIFRIIVITNFVEKEYNMNSFTKYDSILTPSPKDRATFELQISKTHIKFGMPEQPLTSNRSLYWADTEIPELTWNHGVLQLGHHSYNPTKDCNISNTPAPDGTCKPNTWHWDNIKISNSIPFTMIKADKRKVSNSSEVLTFNSPAPQDSYLRFSAIGTVEVSFDEGATWTIANRQNGSAQSKGNHHPEHFSSYWTPVPLGTKTINFKFSADSWYDGSWPYLAKDFSIWSKEVPLGGEETIPTATPTAAALPTATNTPAPTNTPVPTSTPTPTTVSGNQVTIRKALTVKNNDSTLIGTSFNNKANTAKLGKDGSKSVSNFNLFPGLNIPRGVTIISAELSYELVGFGGGTVNTVIAAHNTATPTTPASRSQFESKQRELTSAKVNWNSVSQGDWGTKIKSPNIAPVIQEIVSKSNWNSGNGILIWIGDNGSTNWAHSSYMTANFTGAGQKPTLTITYVE